MEVALSILSVLGINGILLFFIKRFFDKKDSEAKEEKADRDALIKEVRTGLGTIRLLAYARLSEEIERLLNQGYATPSERRILEEMYLNYKDHGWNGDMDARMRKVHSLPTKHLKHQEEICDE